MIKLSRRWFTKIFDVYSSGDGTLVELAHKTKGIVGGGNLHAIPSDIERTLSVTSTGLNDKYQGLGLGKYMYRRASVEASLSGRYDKFQSDPSGRTSAKASHVWNSLGADYGQTGGHYIDLNKLRASVLTKTAAPKWYKMIKEDQLSSGAIDNIIAKTDWSKRFLKTEVSNDASGSLQVILKDKNDVIVGRSITDNRLQKTHGVVSVSDTHLEKSFKLNDTKEINLRGKGLGSHMHKTLIDELKYGGKTKLFTSDITGTTSQEAAKVWERHGAKPYGGYIEKRLKDGGVMRYQPQLFIDLEKTGAYIPGVTKAVGRVFTNLVEPFTYINKPKEIIDLIKTKPIKVLKGIISDTPVYNNTFKGHPFISDAGHTAVRDDLLRKTFKLKKRTNQTDLLDKGTHFEINPTSPYRSDIINAYTYQTDSSLLGAFDKKPRFDKDPEGVLDYYDKFDFALNKGEKVNSVTNLARSFVDKVSVAPEIKGTIRPTGLSKDRLERALNSVDRKNKPEATWMRQQYNTKLELDFKRRLHIDQVESEFIHKRVPDGEVGPKLTAYKNGLRKS